MSKTAQCSTSLISHAMENASPSFELILTSTQHCWQAAWCSLHQMSVGHEFCY